MTTNPNPKPSPEKSAEALSDASVGNAKWRYERWMDLYIDWDSHRANRANSQTPHMVAGEKYFRRVAEGARLISGPLYSEFLSAKPLNVAGLALQLEAVVEAWEHEHVPGRKPDLDLIVLQRALAYLRGAVAEDKELAQRAPS